MIETAEIKIENKFSQKIEMDMIKIQQSFFKYWWLAVGSRWDHWLISKLEQLAER
jgi:hypothetical protein